MALRVAAVFAILIATHGYAQDSIGHQQSAIVGGSSEAYFSEVVALLAEDGALVCSGTLIHPRVVLTAAHCLNAPMPITWAASGSDIRTEVAARSHITTRVAHPGFRGLAGGVDIALLELATPLAAATAELADAATWHELDRGVRLIGYGMDAGGKSDTAGVQRMRQAHLLRLDQERFRHSEGSCSGDSGGAVMDAERDVLVGVISSGAADCRGSAGAVRVDAHRAFINDFVAGVDARTADTGCQTHPAPSTFLFLTVLSAVRTRTRRLARKRIS